MVAPGTRMRVILSGGPGDDVLRGGDGDDVIHGEAGNDRIHGGGGSDVLAGGAGRDRVAAGPVTTRSRAGAANDTISGGRGDDHMYAGPSSAGWSTRATRHAGADSPGADNAERVATGLPIDHNREPATPDQLDPRHPYDCTENALREEMGVRKAPGY